MCGRFRGMTRDLGNTVIRLVRLQGVPLAQAASRVGVSEWLCGPSESIRRRHSCRPSDLDSLREDGALSVSSSSADVCGTFLVGMWMVQVHLRQHPFYGVETVFGFIGCEDCVETGP